MGFSETVLWWEEWQLRLLALASLFIQCFLLVAAPLRKYRIPSLLRFLIWIAFLGSDAVAVYALATLFNRHKKPEWVSTHRDSANLEALWAPILLLHLAGQDSIAAYNIEDNELWRRHIISTLSQISVAIYVFCKSWSGDKKLLQAAILVFVPGIVKCLHKPWGIKGASINSIMKKYSARINVPSEKKFLWFVQKKDSARIVEIRSLEDYVQYAAKYIKGGHKEECVRVRGAKKLFVDIAYPYSVRIDNLEYMMKKKKVHSCLRNELSTRFDLFYTWYKRRLSISIGSSSSSIMSLRVNILCGMVANLLFGAIALFHKSDREAYNHIDVKITYILLCSTAALEYSAAGLIPYLECYRSKSGLPWPDHVAQDNLIGRLARNKKHRRLIRKLASVIGCKDLLDQHWCMEPCKTSKDITQLVYDHVKKGWEEYITDVPSYHRFNGSRGQWTLQSNQCDGGKKMMKSSLRRPFDESVLLWHLATDFCFYQRKDSSASRSREISNYMAYLLSVNPDMLMPGTRSGLFGNAYKQIKDMPLDHDGDAQQKDIRVGKEEEELAQKIMEKLKADPEASQGSGLLKQDTAKPEDSRFIQEAWALARELLAEEKMWEVIQGVWVEMLCFSAARCRGYLHAKSMGSGGEYLTYVWLLLHWMGMEPLSEKMQRTEMKDEGPKGRLTGVRRRRPWVKTEANVWHPNKRCL